MATSNNSSIANAFFSSVHSLGLWPLVAMDNNTVEFVAAMPSGQTAPFRSSGVTRTTVPAILLTHQPAFRTDPTLKGGVTIVDGFADFIVVAPRNGFANQADAIAAQIAELFPVATRIEMATGGKIVINQPVMPMAGFYDGVYWRVVTRVNYRATP